MNKEVIAIDESFFFDDDVLEFRKNFIQESRKEKSLIQMKEMTVRADICIEFYNNGDIEDIYIDYKKIIAHFYVHDTKSRRLCSYDLLDRLESGE